MNSEADTATLLVSPASDASLGENINGPSLIRIPEWIDEPLNQYYLYFAHHQGAHIRLATAADVMGPYSVYLPGVLPLTDAGFPSTPLNLPDITERGILDWIEKYDAETVLPFFPPHVASPDVHVRDDLKEIWMYYHGQCDNGSQLTKLARSVDGLTFVPEPGFLGNSYFRVFEHRGEWFALSHSGGVINRSDDGINFEAGPAIGHPEMRHTAVRRIADERFLVYWSKSGDTPEHILVSDLDVSGHWRSWQIENTRSVRQPVHDWEGANLPVRTSRAGFAAEPLHELRDPGIYEEDGKCWLLYSVKGESGIAIMPLA